MHHKTAYVAGPSGVDEVLHDGPIYYGKRTDYETERDTGDWSEYDVQPVR